MLLITFSKKNMKQNRKQMLRKLPCEMNARIKFLNEGFFLSKIVINLFYNILNYFLIQVCSHILPGSIFKQNAIHGLYIYVLKVQF